MFVLIHVSNRHNAVPPDQARRDVLGFIIVGVSIQLTYAYLNHQFLSITSIRIE